MNEGVLPRTDLGLGGVLHQTLGLLPESVLEDVDDCRPGQPEALEVGAVEHQHLIVGHAENRSGATADAGRDRTKRVPIAPMMTS